MLLTEAIRTFVNIKPGTFTKFAYRSEVPVKAKYKDNVKIVKYSKAIGRFGIKYTNLKSVKEQLSQVPKKDYKKNPNEYWIFKNILKYNKNTDKYYMTVYTSQHKNKNVFLVYTDKGLDIVHDLNGFKEYVLPSYFNKKSSGKETYCVCLDNVIYVGN